MTSLPFALATRALDAILARQPLTEVGAPYRELRSPMSPAPVGTMRVWQGDGEVSRIVYVGLVVPPINLDSHMVFAFTDPKSAVPHFTLDSVYGGAYYAYHLDLIPRAELSSHLAYMDSAYHPLTARYEEASQRDGLTRAHIGPRQHALMSPWMLVHRADEAAFRGMDPIVDAYAGHWLDLVAAGLPAEVTGSLADTDLAARDATVRANLFSPAVDPVWAQVSRLLGEPASDEIRDVLIGGPLS
ncbi:hypothetical protein Daura_34905 [Dactylosporangium aurantiacum]|uniref:Uncharacterized protein n=1 Tax=Dactylosporangium aurantiacum TaxID=35754 RepID=A0A9Q9ICH8_9ACTN|nr:hypothetical protein [Dactylosporangium aurantiacum]MDG6103635.1 hypothetical protein [Dactylosporangium aurantiacum]UWZ51875.1 hypothetical protein Daura_34905 [Dactylosporangium aurantiacum]